MHYVVNKKAMIEAEQKALERGASQEDLIRGVAKGIYHHAEFSHLLKQSDDKPILLLIGRGLNGLDCLALGCELLRHGRQVAACQLQGRQSTPLSYLFFDEFSLLGGSLIQSERIAQKRWGIVIDGLLGLGAHKKKDEELAALLRLVNTLPSPIISIDIPSGIDPETGEVWEHALFAEHTFACQSPKIGSFFQKAFEHVGTLHTIDIGLSDTFSDISILEREDVMLCLPALERMTHKYRKGTVHSIAGSKEMMGAASLTAQASFASGAGYVRSSIPANAYEASIALPLEAVRQLYDPTQPTSLPLLEKGALIVGPGLGKSITTERLLENLLERNRLPVVLDGDGLSSLPQECLDKRYLHNAILTPHRGEAEKLFSLPCQELSQAVFDQLREQAQKLEAVIILKGTPTVLFSPSGSIECMVLGTPALATAGSGDVLSGILGALLATGLSREQTARLGTFLHAYAGQEAALEKTAYSVRATHIIESIPRAFQHLLTCRDISFQSYVPLRLA